MLHPCNSPNHSLLISWKALNQWNKQFQSKVEGRFNTRKTKEWSGKGISRKPKNRPEPFQNSILKKWCKRRLAVIQNLPNMRQAPQFTSKRDRRLNKYRICRKQCHRSIIQPNLSQLSPKLANPTLNITRGPTKSAHVWQSNPKKGHVTCTLQFRVRQYHRSDTTTTNNQNWAFSRGAR